MVGRLLAPHSAQGSAPAKALPWWMWILAAIAIFVLSSISSSIERDVRSRISALMNHGMQAERLGSRFTVIDGTEELPVYGTHLKSDPHCIEMRYNNVELSDPVISYQNINPDKPFEHALYVEDEAHVTNTDNTFADLGGLNVFIRKAEGPVTT